MRPTHRTRASTALRRERIAQVINVVSKHSWCNYKRLLYRFASLMLVWRRARARNEGARIFRGARTQLTWIAHDRRETT
jgi:hypothetical protein